MLDVTSFLTSQTTSKYVLDATLLVLLILSQYVFDATQATSLLAFVCICHTGTTDAAWPQLETYIPNNLAVSIYIMLYPQQLSNCGQVGGPQDQPKSPGDVGLHDGHHL